MKRIATIQDISCLGKCSLTVALPIISAMGVEACVVPTAILSTHTMIDGYTFRDLTEDMPLICNHWKKENFIFDAIYTGYLGSKRQLAIVEEYFLLLKQRTISLSLIRSWAMPACFIPHLMKILPMQWQNFAPRPILLYPTLPKPLLCWMRNISHPDIAWNIFKIC